MKIKISILYTATLICFALFLINCSNRISMKQILRSEREVIIPKQTSSQYAWVTGHLRYRKAGFRMVSSNNHQIPQGKISKETG